MFLNLVTILIFVALVKYMKIIKFRSNKVATVFTANLD